MEFNLTTGLAVLALALGKANIVYIYTIMLVLLVAEAASCR